MCVCVLSICTTAESLLQLCGGFPDTMARCAELISSHASVDFVDINVGCPIDVIFKMVGGGLHCTMHPSHSLLLQGAGSALMNRHTRFESIVRGMVEVSSRSIFFSTRVFL